MDQKEARQRIESLKSEIRELNFEYFVKNREKRTEAVRDALKKELKELEDRFPNLITLDSPTQRVGSALSGKFKKIKHKTRKWSLFDVFSADELGKWAERVRKLVPQEKVEYICELKIDGLNISVWYEKGKFVRGITRGDGVTGEDVTHTIKTVESLPLVLNEPLDLEVSGEVFMSKKTLEKLNETLKKNAEPLLVNPRNAAAGAIRQLDPKIAAERKLEVFFYGIGEISDAERPKTQEDTLNMLKKLGLSVNPEFKKMQTIDDVESFYKDWQKKRENLPYDIDGLVVKVNSLEQQQWMGYTGKAPRHSVAFKFPAEQATSVVEDIIVQVGRTGALTPVAVLKPTFVSGSTVSRATLHNEDEIHRKDVRTGDTVVIQKAGDIIPEVVEVIKKLRPNNAKKFNFPKNCPICGARVTRAEGEKIARCSNRKCYAQDYEKLRHFVGKAAFDIDGLGPRVVSQLMEAGLVRDPSDFFTLTKNDLLGLDLFKEKRAENLIKALKTARAIPLPRFLFALGIRYFGEQTSDDLSRHIGNHPRSKGAWTISRLIDELHPLTMEELESIDGIGAKVAASLYDWFHENANLDMLRKLERAGIELKVGEPKKNTPFSGKTVVITGTLESMTRDQAKAKIKELGGKVASSVGKDTNFLIMGENPGSKLKKAQSLGLKIVNEKDFIKMTD